MVCHDCYEKKKWSLGTGKELTPIPYLKPLMGSKASSSLSNVDWKSMVNPQITTQQSP